MSKQTSSAEASRTDTVNSSSADQPQKAAREVVQARLAHRFSQVVAVMMRDPKFKKLKLEDLEWLVIPPVLSGQFRMGYATRSAGEPTKGPGGFAHPVAVALWASVSDKLDKEMRENPDKQFRLSAAEWTSGKNLWLIATCGEPRAIGPFVQQLSEKDFKGKTVSMRAKDKAGKPVIMRLGNRFE